MESGPASEASGGGVQAVGIYRQYRPIGDKNRLVRHLWRHSAGRAERLGAIAWAQAAPFSEGMAQCVAGGQKKRVVRMHALLTLYTGNRPYESSLARAP